MRWRGRALFALCAAVVASAVPAPASHAVPPEVFTWTDLPRGAISVTEGFIGTESRQLLPGIQCLLPGCANPQDTRLTTSSRVLRAVQKGPWARHARLRFLYHGKVPVSPESGIWPQIGLKLRTPNTCNVVYVMWHQADAEGTPRSLIAIVVKRNRGLDTHEECLKVPDHGYTEIKTIPVPRDHRFGGWQTLEARTSVTGARNLDLQVFANGTEVFHDLLLASQFGPFIGAGALDGPIGLRSDGGRYSFRLGR